MTSDTKTKWRIGQTVFVLTAITIALASIIGTFRHGCFFLNTTHLPCPGCGITRAFQAFFRLDFYRAFQYHPMFIVLLLVPVTYIIYMARHIWKRHQEQQLHQPQSRNPGQRFLQITRVLQALWHGTSAFFATKVFYTLLGVLLTGYIAVYAIRILIPLFTHGDPFYIFLLSGRIEI